MLYRAFAAVIASAAVLFQPQTSTAQDRTFSDWTVACSSSDYCAAETVDRNSSDIDKPDNILRIGRHAGTSARWEISVITQKTTPTLLGPAQFRIAGQRPLKLSPNRDYTLFDVSNEFFLTGSSSNQPLLRRMAESRRAFVTLGERTSNQVKASFSLIGLAEALLWIDGQQGREGSRRVVAAPTKRDEPPTQTSGTDITSDAVSLALIQHQQEFGDQSCSITSSDARKETTLVESLDEVIILVGIPCIDEQDNTISAIYLVNTSTKTTNLQLWAIYSETNGWQGTKTLSNVRFNPETKELTSQYLTDAENNCRMEGRWLRTNNQFVMKEFKAEDRCDDSAGFWRQIFP